jgi:hypothetical protein
MHRKKLAARVVAGLAVLASLSPGAARAGIDDGLVALYTFDGADATDASGNGNDGVAVGDVTYVDGWHGKALKLGGYSSPGYVTAAPSASLAFLDDYTFAAWFNVESDLSMDGWGWPTDNGLHTVFAKAGDRNGLDVRVGRSSVDGVRRVFLFDGWCCGGGAGIQAEGGIELGQWHHVAVTSGGGFVRLYLDGALAGELPTDVFAVNPQMQYMPLQLGIDQSAWWYPLDGMLDEVRVYRRALTANEVAVLANRDTAAPVITITTPADGSSFLLGAGVLADWSATDALSGVCSANGTVPSGAPIDTATLGPHSFVVVATDCAGNSASAESTYFVRYAFGGFLPPVRDDGSSIFRQGSTIPVKFQLRDASGAIVSTASATLTYALVADGIVGTVEEAISSAAATEGNLFRFDPVSEQYVFNLSTDLLAPAKTYQLTAAIDDGSTRSVIVSIR